MPRGVSFGSVGLVVWFGLVDGWVVGFFWFGFCFSFCFLGLVLEIL